jgi:hypothetical protein
MPISAYHQSTGNKGEIIAGFNLHQAKYETEILFSIKSSKTYINNIPDIVYSNLFYTLVNPITNDHRYVPLVVSPS